jgi:hypothetical protein
MTALILAGGLITFLVGAACGGLIVKTLSESAQSKAAAWVMAGQLGGGALGAALILWLAARVPIATVGVCVAVLVAVPGLLAFTIPEPSPNSSAWFRVSADLKRSHFGRSGVCHPAPELASVHTSTRAANR